jgi:hypothetical protein
MNRRNLIATVIAFLSGAAAAKAEDAVACRLLGHQWAFDRNEPCETEPLCKGWWWEFFKCKRCGAERRELVASPRG